jgi:hypothetical protein
LSIVNTFPPWKIISAVCSGGVVGAGIAVGRGIVSVGLAPVPGILHALTSKHNTKNKRFMVSPLHC